MAGKLHNEGIKRGHFDIIIIDEAGQAIEPETVAPVAALLGPQGMSSILLHLQTGCLRNATHNPIRGHPNVEALILSFERSLWCRLHSNPFRTQY